MSLGLNTCNKNSDVCSIGEAFYNKTLDCIRSHEMGIDYTNKKGYRGWSPNNVRRLVLAPDNIVMQYYVPELTYDNKEYKRVSIGPILSHRCINSNEYRPAISAITGVEDGRLCSGVEEIVIFERPMPRNYNCAYPDGKVPIMRKEEHDLSLLTKTDGGILELERRFPRLKYITLVHSDIYCMSKYMHSMIENGTYLTEFIMRKEKGIGVSVVHRSVGSCYEKSPVLRGYKGSRGYIEDGESGRLYQYFRSMLNS